MDGHEVILNMKDICKEYPKDEDEMLSVLEDIDLEVK